MGLPDFQYGWRGVKELPFGFPYGRSHTQPPLGPSIKKFGSAYESIPPLRRRGERANLEGIR
jgi:hypothetical protein